MADFTQNYGLHQWEPTDPFLREDFNQDFSTIDTALGRAERSAEANAYNVYNLMLQNYYESKYTGYKKALIFDGFLDESGIAEKSEALYLYEGKLFLPGLPAKGPGTPYSSDYIQMQGTCSTLTYTAQARYQLTRFTWKMIGAGENTWSVTAVLYHNGVQERTINQDVRIYGSFREVSIDLPSVQMEPGDTFYLTISGFSSNCSGYTVEGSGHLAGYFSVSSLTAETGTLTSQSISLETYDWALGWVRYRGGSISCLLNGVKMDLVETTETVDLQGNACIQAAFRLEDGGSGPVAVTLTLDRGEDDTIIIYDYGIIFL